MNFDDLASVPCSVVNEYMRHLFTFLPSDEERDRLLGPILLRVKEAGQPTLEAAVKRGWMQWDWYIRTFIPAWLKLTPSKADLAKTIEELPPIVDDVSSRQAMQFLCDAGYPARDAIVTAYNHIRDHYSSQHAQAIWAESVKFVEALLNP